MSAHVFIGGLFLATSVHKLYMFYTKFSYVFVGGEADVS
jgi:hypothetical protein